MKIAGSTKTCIFMQKELTFPQTTRIPTLWMPTPCIQSCWQCEGNLWCHRRKSLSGSQGYSYIAWPCCPGALPLQPYGIYMLQNEDMVLKLMGQSSLGWKYHHSVLWWLWTTCNNTCHSGRWSWWEIPVFENGPLSLSPVKVIFCLTHWPAPDSGAKLRWTPKWPCQIADLGESISWNEYSNWKHWGRKCATKYIQDQNGRCVK